MDKICLYPIYFMLKKRLSPPPTPTTRKSLGLMVEHYDTSLLVCIRNVNYNYYIFTTRPQDFLVVGVGG